MIFVQIGTPSAAGRNLHLYCSLSRRIYAVGGRKSAADYGDVAGIACTDRDAASAGVLFARHLWKGNMDVDCQCDFRSRAYRDSSAASEGDRIVKRVAHYDYVFLFASVQIQLRKIQPQILENPRFHLVGKGVEQGLIP